MDRPVADDPDQRRDTSVAPEEIHVRFTKWDGSLHWHFSALPIGDDEHGTWVSMPPGSSYQRGDEPPRIDEHGFVVLIPHADWWVAYFDAVSRSASGQQIYIDVATPVEWDGTTAQMIDLDLDVVRTVDDRVVLLDEDEFLDHQVAYGYPPRVIDQARAAAAALHQALGSHSEPFGRESVRHLADALGWIHGTVAAGYGVASGRAEDARFPDGTLSLQWPHLRSAGVPVDGLHRATINVVLPLALDPRAARWRLEHLEWSAGYPAETFDLFEARLAFDGSVYDAIVYRPDPTTKPEFDQPEGVVEVLAPKIDGIEPGMPVSLWIDPAQAGFVG